MFQKPRSSSSDQSRIPMLSKKRSTSISRNEFEESHRYSMQPKQSLASSSRQQGSLCYSASNSRAKGAKDYMKEVRPVGEKPFQDKMKAEMIRFLSKNNLPERFLKSLHNPSNSDFKAIVEYLASCLFLPDSFTLAGKLEDSALELLNWLDYPFQVPKRSFQTIGVLHMWPTMLAILDYMRVLAESNNDLYHKIVESLPTTEKEMLRYELRTYSFFLSAHDDYSKDLAELEEKIAGDRNFKKENEELEMQVHKLQMELEPLSKSLAVQNQELDAVDKEVAKKFAYNVKLCDIVKTMDFDFVQKNKDISTLKSQAQNLDDEISMHSLEAEQREAEIKRQGQLGFDVHKLESDFKQAKKYNCDLEKETSSIKNMIESQQSLSSSLMEEIKGELLEFKKSTEIMSVLTREEEELFFSLNLVIGREPQSIKSIEQLVSKTVGRVNLEKKKLDELLGEQDVESIKQAVTASAEKAHQLQNNSKILDREVVNVMEMHQREEEDYIEQVQKKKEAYEKNYAEFSAFSDQAQTLLNEFRAEDQKLSRVKEVCLEAITRLTRTEKMQRFTIDKFIARSREILEEDRQRIKEYFLVMKANMK